MIQQILNITDRETIEQIKENPYLQYFLGFSSYEYKAPFSSSTLVYFRKRIDPKLINKINRQIVKQNLETETEKKTRKWKNKGKKK